VELVEGRRMLDYLTVGDLAIAGRNNQFEIPLRPARAGHPGGRPRAVHAHPRRGALELVRGALQGRDRAELRDYYRCGSRHRRPLATR